ncbi:MAG: hypothetical protein SOR61_04795 [Evtepia sp.]|uniref:hypothetical protein n=1 Tax=Evtepia sp. TaxID=2773933 RepID=UPI002A74EF16|nr:hypothetical protein [Evtepia sp.]MDY3014500.1 hypothetical protein [Evtepia sp.]
MKKDTYKDSSGKKMLARGSRYGFGPFAGKSKRRISVDDVRRVAGLPPKEGGYREMTYYHTCPQCGAHLDPGERCDCQDKEKELSGATNAEQLKGGTKGDITTVSSPLYNKNGGNAR